jgi:hypothetical protein
MSGIVGIQDPAEARHEIPEEFETLRGQLAFSVKRRSWSK